MGLFSRNSNDNASYDYEKLRRDLIDEFGAQSAAFSDGFGFLEMCDAEDASNEQLLEMARREGFNLEKNKI